MTERRRDKLKAMFTRSPSKIGPGSTIYSGLRTSLSLLKEVADATELPVLKGAVGGLLRVVEIIEKTAQNQDDAIELLNYLKCLEKIFNNAQNSKIPKPLADRIEELSQEIIKIVQDIEKIKSQGSTVKFLRNDRDASAITGHMQKINRLFSKFQFGSSVALESGMMDLKQDVKRLIQDALPRAVGARFDMENRQRCLEGTRVELLNTVCRWALQNDPLDPESCASIFWLCGQAGTGKTTICSSVADNCSAHGRLGASFFFSRDREDRNNIRLVFPTIALQLGSFCEAFEVLVTEVFRRDPELVHSDPQSQLEKLIIHPLKDCVSFPSGTVITMDALDECKDKNSISTLLSMISKNRHRLPRLKFFITSRPENCIRLGFRPLREITHSVILHDIDTAVVNADLELYLRDGFSTAHSLYPYLVPEQGWPSDEEITLLVNKSSRLFIFAATALKFIMDESYSDPINQLTLLLEQPQGCEPSSSPFFYLDQMYLQVLHQACPNTMPSDRLDLLRKVLGAIVLVRNPLSPGDLEGFLGLRRGIIRTALRHLHSIMVVPDTDEDTIRLIHPSFFDFIATERCQDLQFRINVSFHHEHLATLCFKQMKSLKRDICEIKDASKLNREVQDLPQRIEQHIHPALRYACHHWVYHICGAGEIPSLQTSLDEFCHEKLLYWIEALSLIGPESLRGGIRHIQALQTHATTYPSFPNAILTILKDALAFITEYFDFISPASLQLYRTALPLSSPSNSLRKAFSHELSGGVHVLKRPQEENYSGVTVLRGHSEYVNSAKFSPDEALVVSASRDEIRLWDKGTGTLLKILKMGDLSSPVYFFQGRDRIISTSGRDSIFICDTTSGTRLRTTKLEAVNRRIVNFTCSSDVTQIAGCAGGDIMIWDVSNGSLLNTLSQHEKVRSVTLSPNHMLIASASQDGTIQIWNAVSGAALNTLTGHSWFVEAISFSPCSKFLVSGSFDRDLRLWDISCGIALKTFKGHSSLVCSVAFSHDGTQIISGSYDDDLRVWNVVDGELLKSLRLGGDGVVLNVGFSIDGSQYICTWRDAIYIWNADHASDLNQREEQFRDINFSLDGTLLIASTRKEYHLLDGLTGDSLMVIEGFDDYHLFIFSPNSQYGAFVISSIYLWDISSSTAPRRLKGHSEHIRSIAFSSDSTRIVSTSDDETLRIWDTASGDNIFTVEANHPFAEFSPDGSQIIANDHYHYDIPSHIRPDPVPLNSPVPGQLRYSIEGEWVFAYRGDKKERCIWLPADWRRLNARVSSRGRVVIGTDYGLALLDLSYINLSI